MCRRVAHGGAHGHGTKRGGRDRGPSGSSLAVSARNEQGLRFAGLAAVTLREAPTSTVGPAAAGRRPRPLSPMMCSRASDWRARYDFRRPILSGVGRTSLRSVASTFRGGITSSSGARCAWACRRELHRTDRPRRAAQRSANFRDFVVRQRGRRAGQMGHGLSIRRSVEPHEDDLTKVEMLGWHACST